MNELPRNRDQNVDGPRSRVRMRLFHMHDAFVFRTFKLWKVRVYERRFACVGMHVEQRSVNRGQEQRYHGAPGDCSSHGRILAEPLGASQSARSSDVRRRGVEDAFSTLNDSL